MKIILYIFLTLTLSVIAIFVWFFKIYLSVPELVISSEMSSPQKMEVADRWFASLESEFKFNGVVMVVENGDPLLAKGYGYTNHKKDTRLNADSSLRLASVSKQFTAAGIMLLKERGKLVFDDLVSKHIEGFPYHNVTIRHLLNQTSGVPDIYMELAEKNEATISVLTNRLAVDLIIKEKRVAKSSPNQQYKYSNTNYILLARIIEIKSGLSFEEFMEAELFAPLGMQNTRVWNLVSKKEKLDAQADDFDNIEGLAIEVSPTFIDGVAGDGAVFSSANDMLIWDRFWYENDLISETTLQEAFKKPTLSNGSQSDYGFGWMITSKGAWHNGSWLGASTVIIRNTNKRATIVILDNSSNIYFDNIIKESLALIR